MHTWVVTRISPLGFVHGICSKFSNTLMCSSDAPGLKKETILEQSNNDRITLYAVEWMCTIVLPAKFTIKSISPLITTSFSGSYERGCSALQSYARVAITVTEHGEQSKGHGAGSTNMNSPVLRERMRVSLKLKKSCFLFVNTTPWLSKKNKKRSISYNHECTSWLK